MLLGSRAADVCVCVCVLCCARVLWCEPAAVVAVSPPSGRTVSVLVRLGSGVVFLCELSSIMVFMRLKP